MLFWRRKQAGASSLNVFVSYSRTDLETVEVLVDDLKSQGHSVWFDQQLSGGQSWWDDILQNIRSCDVFVPFLSMDWIKSHPCMSELRYALALNRNILPIALDKDQVISSLPPELLRIQILSYSVSNREDLKKLLHAINRFHGSSPLPKVLPEPPPVPVSRHAGIASKLQSPTLSGSEQASILFEIEELLTDPGEILAAAELLDRLKSHPDVRWSIAEKIDAIQHNLPVAPEQGQSRGDAHGVLPRRHGSQPMSREELRTWGELEQIYRTRTEFDHAFSYVKMFDKAQMVLAVGISLNSFALNYPRESIQEILLRGGSCKLCFLKPASIYCAAREREEDLPAGSLAGLTAGNINQLRNIRSYVDKTDHDSALRLEALVYDLPPRYNIYIVNGDIMTVQSYGYVRGEDTPTFVLRRKVDGGLFDFFASVAQYILSQSERVPDAIIDRTIDGAG